jgi:pimeloyl-ACP methyl ester carboxylesterase
MRDEFVEVIPGCRTWVRIVGGAGRLTPVVALHGDGASHESLAWLVAFAAAGRPVILYDRLGTGRSDRRCESSGDLALRELTGVHAHFRLGRVHLVGVGTGATVAAAWARAHPAAALTVVALDRVPVSPCSLAMIEARFACSESVS